MNKETDNNRWSFWIDRGGTFTDIVARRPDGRLVSHKLLSENPEQYEDAALAGIRALLDLDVDAPIPPEAIEAVKMGTTVATNALLERKGDPVALVTTKGFADALRIGYQARPNLFDLQIRLPQMLYSDVVEVGERVTANGEVLVPLDWGRVRANLQRLYDGGLRGLAILLMHGYRYPEHERAIARIADEIGFTQVSVSHRVSPLIKLVGRGDTTVVDAYLSPVLRRYVDRVDRALGGSRLLFMQSNGGLADAHFFQGKDAILSGPAGGVVGAARTAAEAGFEQVIGFDMGGTSTDVCHYSGDYERSLESEVAGVRLRAPMMRIHTVAAGGGSVLHFDGSRYLVGPDSAGANPGPACYRRGGPLTVTDCNVMLGKLQPEFFPQVFGPGADQPLDAEIVRTKFSALAEKIRKATGDERTPEQVAEGFLAIAVENMASAIKKISVQRGYEVSKYLLNSFGGAGGQHACLVADALGMTKILLHRYAGVLSAYGIGLADLRLTRERSLEHIYSAEYEPELNRIFDELEADGRREMLAQGVPEQQIHCLRKLHLKYEGTDTALEVAMGGYDRVLAEFERDYRQQFGFVAGDKPLVVEAVQVEVIGAATEERLKSRTDLDRCARRTLRQVASSERGETLPGAKAPITMDGKRRETPIYRAEALCLGEQIDGPAVISEPNSTIVVEPGWRAEITDTGILLQRVEALPKRTAIGTSVDPVMLEIFNNLFMSIAEQMGAALEKTASSVNIKERRDFSCALFDRDGELIANAPHMPVHLGSMSESIKTVIRENASDMKDGDAFVLNAPYNGGTHLPDITVIRPVFGEGSDDSGEELLFYVATRGHHADVGGITPGSMPPFSKSVEEEGVLLDNLKLVDAGTFCDETIRRKLASGKYPARNIPQNIADLHAQLAACEKGVRELQKMVAHFGLSVVRAYMQHVQGNAEESVRRTLEALHDGDFRYQMDDGSVIRVAVTLDRENRRATVDFTGTSGQHPGNYNAPRAVTKAAVLYVFRCLVRENIPLNGGCLKPLDIVIPEGCMLNPQYPAAVVAGNVETSQYVVDALFGALETMAAAQGTMNNFTFGDGRYQYYETLCGGSGAGPDFDGTDAVHTHMTNSRLTDPEVLEWRFPVLLEAFSVRRGSGGAGKHKGGDGARRRLRFLQPMTASILASHRKLPPFGLNGGEPGALGRNWVERAGGGREELDGRAEVQMEVGDVFAIETPGGGGYGAA
ncbi:hydantoinase B/oxoprolinase family protein [Microbulbifer litoralis]|uniref:hydantoinase B/oxoprolinase family protein n=1 Tax=Microbulbifer litoralis TaxID=2933965 RepID=UPI0020284589|nr:hydantoinase B/oxoprolinase family protein [Microbulbifer sp. GX H0434]